METPVEHMMETRCCRAVIEDWLLSHLGQLELQPREQYESRLFRVKCLNEAALYLIWLDALELPASAHSPLLRTCVTQLCSDPLLDWCCRSSARSLMCAHILAYALQHRDLGAARKQRLRTALGGRFCWHAEAVPCRQLDLLLACHYARVTPPISADAILRVSSVSLPPSPIHSDRNAFYAMAGTVIFRLAAGGTINMSRDQKLRIAIEGGLCRALATADFDLGAELAICALADPACASPAVSLLFHAIAQELARTGVVGGQQRLSEPEGRFLARCPDEEWARFYHTTLVTAMLLAFMEQRGFAQVAAPGADARKRRMGEVLHCLHGYQLSKALAALEGFHPQDDVELGLFEEIYAFFDFIRTDEGHFGCVTEEREIFDAHYPGGDFDAAVMAPLARDAVRFMAAREAVPSQLAETEC